MVRTKDMIQSEIIGFQQLLTNSDYKAIKHSEGELTDAEYEETKQLRASWRTKINELQEELKAWVDNATS